MSYKIGQEFNTIYPPEAADWCNAHNAHIEQIDDGYIIVENPEPTEEELLEQMEKEAQEELDRRLSVYLTPEAQALAIIDEEYATQRKEVFTDMLAVKKQQGWPLEVVWPKEKQGKF